MAEVSDPQRDFYTRLMSQYRGRTLKRGDRSKSTRALQLFLREQGYDIKADGVFGKRTEAALREYQKANGLSADGQAGKKTLTKVREQITPRPKERPTQAPEAPVSEPIGLGGARPVPRARPAPSFEPEIMPPMPSATALPAPPAGPPPFQGTPPMDLPPPPSPPPSALESVPTGVGANQAAFMAGQQSPPGGGLSDVTEAMMGPAPGILSPSYPVGAGGARPTPGARPGRLAAPPPMPPMSQGEMTPQTIALIQALMAGQGV